MLLINYCQFAPTIAPIPVKYIKSDIQYGLGELSISCKYADGSACRKHIVDNFNFYLKIMYPRDPVFTKSEYSKHGISNVVQQVQVIISSSSENYDIGTLDESYTLDVDTQTIKITCQNNFGAARAFASLVQLTDKLNELPLERKAYGINKAYVEDHPVFKWRQLLVDGARHFLPISKLQLTIDTLALAKMNVLHLHAVDAESFPLKFSKLPQSNLVLGAWNRAYYYSIQDMKELQKYAFQRGVILYLEVDTPGHCNSWKNADPKLIANCPSYNRNINNVPVNPAYPKTYEYVRGMMQELLVEGPFNGQEFNIKPMIHLGGDEVIGSCWAEDKDIKKYMTEKGLSISGLWREWHQKVHDIISEVTDNGKPYQVYWNDAMDNENYFGENSVVHYWTTSDKTRALNKGLKVIQSTYWYLDKMHPTESTHYFFQDTWKDFYKVDMFESVPPSQRNLVLGGGACQWGETVWGPNFLAHMFPRALSISEVLWSHPEKRTATQEVIDRFEHLSCKMRQSGLNVGVLDPAAPCLGE